MKGARSLRTGADRGTIVRLAGFSDETFRTDAGPAAQTVTDCKHGFVPESPVVRAGFRGTVRPDRWVLIGIVGTYVQPAGAV